MGLLSRDTHAKAEQEQAEHVSAEACPVVLNPERARLTRIVQARVLLLNIALRGLRFSMGGLMLHDQPGVVREAARESS